MRVPHFLKGNISKAAPTRIILFDTETKAIPLGEDKEKHILKLGVACYWHRREKGTKDIYKWLTFRDENTFWDWVIEQSHAKTRLVLSSHNLSFDLPILHAFKQLPKRKFKLTAYYCKGRTTLARFRRGSKKLDFVDNTNFYSGSLANLAPLVGLPKLEVDFSTVGDSELETYCQRDVKILLLLWQKWFDFLEIHDLGKWSRTLPSQAFTAFRHRFLDYQILIHDHKRTLKLERSAYHGGRVEVLRVGCFRNGPFYKLDVNSMYPYVMHKYSYPVSLFRYIAKGSVPSLKDKLSRYHVVADCLIDTPDPAFPYWVNGHIAYPTGVFRVALTTRELEHVLKVGRVLEVYRMAYYYYAPIFTKYVDYFYPLKCTYTQNDNQAFRKIVKGFLNYLYGKFGQRGLSDSVIGACPIDETKIVQVCDKETGEYYDLIYLAGQIIKRQRQEESYNSFPAIAAEVTANARLYLHSLIKQAGREHTYYVDTDSLIVDQVGLNRLSYLLHDLKLGSLKLEGVATEITIRAAKDYTFADKIKIKGIRSNAVQLAPNVYQQARFPSIQGLLHKENLDDYIVTQVVKHLQRKIYTGNVTTQGQVVPFQLSLPLPSLPVTSSLPS